MSETVGRARQRLTQAVNSSCDGDDVEARRHIRDAMQLLDAELADELEVHDE